MDMTTPPTPEAVEAAMRYATFKKCPAVDFAVPTVGTAARILAAEVERLRAELEECRTFHHETISRHHSCGEENLKLRTENELLVAKIEQLNRAIDNQHKMMSQWLNRRASVEDVLYSVAAGKRGPLTPDECRDLAKKLGVPEK